MPSLGGYWCGSCKEECDAHVIDDGIGHYEFWGRPGFDSKDVAVSSCCDYAVFDDPECMIETDVGDLTEGDPDAERDYKLER